MCLAGHREVFDVAEDGTDLSRAEKKQTGEKTTFKLCNHVWELEVKITPTAQNRERVGQHAASVSCRLAFFGRTSVRFQRSPRSRPAVPGPSHREDDLNHDPNEVHDDHDLACRTGLTDARSTLFGPTKQQGEDHEAAGHVLYQSWRRARAAGRGRGDAR